MGVLEWLGLRQKPEPESARLGSKISEGTASGAAILMSSWGSPDNERIRPGYTGFAEQGYAGNGVIFSCILARLMLFSEAEFVYRNRSTMKLWANAGLAVLEMPWRGGSTGELLARMEQDASLAGNAYIRKGTRLDGSTFLERLRPDLVTIVSALVEDIDGHEHREVIGYFYDPSTFDSERQSDYYDVADVAHWSPIPDPMAQFRGMSWLTPIVREIDADTDLTGYKIRYLENAATPNMIIKYEQQLTDEVIESVGARMKARHGGVDNAFKTLILDRGADFTVVGADLQKLEYTTVQAAGESRIASAAGVPGIVVGLKEGLQAATYSNYAQAMRRFADLTMRPLWRSACAALAKLAEVPADSRLWWNDEQIAALRQGEMERAQTFAVQATTASKLIQVGYESTSVAAAVQACDLSMLTHSGLIPVQLLPPDPGTDPTAADPMTSDAGGQAAA
jgi:phage portal protein BeeE